MELVRFIFSAIFICAGLLVFIIGVVGVYRFKFVMNRMHSAAMLDTLGLFSICVGAAIANGWDANIIKIMLIFIFLWCTSPVSSHLIAKLEYLTDDKLKDEINNDLTEIMEDNSDDSI